VSDAFNSFDETIVGDSGPINRTIGSGPVDTINWILPLQRLILGAQGAEYSARSSSLDEVITPTTFNIKACATQGSAAVPAAKVDQHGVFVQRDGTKLYELAFDLRTYDYNATDLSAFVPELGRPGFIRVAVQRQPDTRIHAVRSDGTACVLVYDTNEDVQAWITVTTQGTIEDVVVLPGAANSVEDQVYYVVNRTINGSTVRYLEKWALEYECRGDLPLCKLADSFVTYTGAPTTTITAANLANQSVVVWADGADVGTVDSTIPWTQTYTTNGSGQITLAVAASNVVVGLPYTAQFKSSKIGRGIEGIPTPLAQQKRINHIGLIMADVHAKGLQYGTDFSNLRDLPGIEAGTTRSGVYATYDEQEFEFDGTWDTDLRICLQAVAPRPCTLLACVLDIDMNS